MAHSNDLIVSRMQELELALQEEQNQSSDPIDLDDTPATAHEKIAETFRPQVWKKYLDIGGKESKVIFSDIYDLPEQNELRNDCKQIVGKLKALRKYFVVPEEKKIMESDGEWTK